MSSKFLQSYLSHLVRNVKATKPHHSRLHQPRASSAILFAIRPTHYHFPRCQQFHSPSPSGTAETSNGKVADRQTRSLPAWFYPAFGLAGLGVFGFLYSRYKFRQICKRGKEQIRDLGGDVKEGYDTSKEWAMDKWKKMKKKLKKDPEEYQKPSQSNFNEK